MMTHAGTDTEPIRIEPGHDSDTGPQQVMALKAQKNPATGEEYTHREIAKILHVSPSTVARWKAKATEASGTVSVERRRQAAQTLMLGLLCVSLLTIAAALASMAWG